MPGQWAHGDTTSATKLNQYGTALNTLHGLLGDTAEYALAPDAGGSGAIFYLTHLQRWLWFRGTGELVSADGLHTVGLSDTDNAWTALDLEGVDWLYYGDNYAVTGVTSCCEDLDP